MEERRNLFVEDEQFQMIEGGREWWRPLKVLDIISKEWSEFRGEEALSI